MFQNQIKKLHKILSIKSLSWAKAIGLWRQQYGIATLEDGKGDVFVCGGQSESFDDATTLMYRVAPIAQKTLAKPSDSPAVQLRFPKVFLRLLVTNSEYFHKYRYMEL